MRFVIYKYSFGTHISTADIILNIPAVARVIKVSSQRNDEICLWILQDLDFNNVERKFVIRKTGFRVQDNLGYCGTALFDDGEIVLHVFEDLIALEAIKLLNRLP